MKKEIAPHRYNLVYFYLQKFVIPVKIVCHMFPFSSISFYPFSCTQNCTPTLQAVPSHLDYRSSLLSASFTVSLLDLVYFKCSLKAFSSLNSTFIMLLLYLKTFYGLWVLKTSQLDSSPWSYVGTLFSSCFSRQMSFWPTSPAHKGSDSAPKNKVNSVPSPVWYAAWMKGHWLRMSLWTRGDWTQLDYVNSTQGRTVMLKRT